MVLNNPSNRFSFSLTSLLEAISIISVACAALAYPTQLWASIISSLTLAVLSLAVIAAFIFRGRSRAFWGGFAFAGWLFIVIDFVHLPLVNFAKEDLLPNFIADQLGHWRYYPNSNWYFGYICRFLFTLILAWLAGLFAVWCHHRARQEDE